MNSRALARIESLGAAPNPQEMKGTSRGLASCAYRTSVPQPPQPIRSLLDVAWHCGLSLIVDLYR